MKDRIEKTIDVAAPISRVRRALILVVEPERRRTFTWRPYAIDPTRDEALRMNDIGWGVQAERIAADVR